MFHYNIFSLSSFNLKILSKAPFYKQIDQWKIPHDMYGFFISQGNLNKTQGFLKTC